MPITVYKVRDLRRGDRILSVGHLTYNPPREVIAELAPIGSATAVAGVRVALPQQDSPTEWVLFPPPTESALYPALDDGLPIVVMRNEHPPTGALGDVGAARQ